MIQRKSQHIGKAPEPPAPVVVKDASGALAGVGEPSDDDFARALEESTPEEFRDAPAGDKPTDDALATDKPAVDKPADKPAADPQAELIAKPVADKGAAAKPADKPAAVATDKPAVEKPVADAAKPVALDPAEEITLGDDLKYSRGQLANAVRQYPELIASANEAIRFRKTFGVDGDTAEKQWGPIVKRLNEDKPFADYVTKSLTAFAQHGGQDFAEYFDRCVASWETHLAETEGIPDNKPREPVDLEARRRLQQIESAEADRASRETRSYIENEARTLQLGDTRLQDPEIMATVWEYAMNRGRTDDGYTLTRAAHDCERRISQMWAGSALNKAPVAEKPVPALVAASGAAPAGTRQQENLTDEQQYPSLRDPRIVKDWLAERAKLGFTE